MASGPRAGAMLPLIAVCLVIIFCSVVIGVDIARMHVTRSELRTATDAASRAGAEALGRLQTANAAVDAAIDVARRNTVAGKPLNLRRDQVQVGRTALRRGQTNAFEPNVNPLNSVRVIGDRRTGSPDGPVGLFFGSLFGLTQFEPIQFATACRLDRDISLVLDISGSMSQNQRMQGLRNALRIFLTELQRTPHPERVSLIVYSTSARKVLPLTEDLNAIQTEFQRFSPNGFTAIGEGLRLGLDSVSGDPLARGFAEKTVIVMTDGNHNTGVSPDVVARNAGSRTIHTITFGADANPTLMRRVAQLGNGTYLHANTNQQLEEVFRDMARQLSVLLVE